MPTDGQIEKQLSERLRNIYDDDDFVFCALKLAKTEENLTTMLRFIEYAGENGDDVTADDITMLSVAMRRTLD